MESGGATVPAHRPRSSAQPEMSAIRSNCAIYNLYYDGSRRVVHPRSPRKHGLRRGIVRADRARGKKERSALSCRPRPAGCLAQTPARFFPAVEGVGWNGKLRSVSFMRRDRAAHSSFRPVCSGWMATRTRIHLILFIRCIFTSVGADCCQDPPKVTISGANSCSSAPALPTACR